MPLEKKSYFNSVNIGTIPRFITGKKPYIWDNSHMPFKKKKVSLCEYRHNTALNTGKNGFLGQFTVRYPEIKRHYE